MLFRWIIAVLVGYALGSVSSSVLISRFLYRRDVRREGSGNAGATNMARIFGMSSGVVTLVCDILKAFLACWIGRRLAGEWGVFLGGIACDVGHCWPVFFDFKGGKGVSVGTAVAILMGWRVILIAAAAFAAGALLSKRVSVGSLSAALALMLTTAVLPHSLPCRLLALAAALLVIYRHVPNIRRLLRGEEPEFRAAKQG